MLVQVIIAFDTRFWPAQLYDVVCTHSFVPEMWMTQHTVIDDSSKHLHAVVGEQGQGGTIWLCAVGMDRPGLVPVRVALLRDSAPPRRSRSCSVQQASPTQQQPPNSRLADFPSPFLLLAHGSYGLTVPWSGEMSSGVHHVPTHTCAHWLKF